MVGIRELAFLELDCFVLWQERNLWHTPIVTALLGSTRHTRRLMFQEIEAKLSAAIEQQLAAKFNVNMKVTLEQPKQRSFGELAIPVAFQLARQLKRSPQQIATELLADLEKVPGVASLEIAGNGYINVRLD